MIEKKALVEILDALAHEARLDVFVALVEAGPPGLSAGGLASALGIAPNALSFHLNRLRRSGLVESWRDGQHIVYAARYEHVEGLMAFLGERCCARSDEACSPACDARRTPGGEPRPEPAGPASGAGS
ncbi:metalloregulator ArsR/SmtB family transcription factor [Aquisalimonas lutea]|uniref:ArsR/SmtB family transcription factor n=1 Tax=Aquisalimonas lutea TaxID=1327750 RepID=UPI0025B56C5E|nr:metalloregulator ArsR/SmtB family transcription factor [Aquisalimonas lutea]MDN3518043.1 metalloregulator ArsR/SmtB family transcription factor [Aquisalimonas lutea]